MSGRTFFDNLHRKHPELGIMRNSFDESIRMEVFDAFGAPGHKLVHSGLLVAYSSLAEELLVGVTVDLQAISGAGLESGAGLQEAGLGKGGEQCVLVQQLTTLETVCMETWEHRVTLDMSLLDLIDTVAAAMKIGQERGGYHLTENNCIHFKNDILSRMIVKRFSCASIPASDPEFHRLAS